MSNYWEDRAARRMYEDMKTAEEAATDIWRLYSRASWYIEAQGRDIFTDFETYTGLSETDARELIKTVQSPQNMQALLSYAAQIKDPVKREAYLTWVRALETQAKLARLASLQQAIDMLVPMLYQQELQAHRAAYTQIIQEAYLHRQFDIQQYANAGQYIRPLDARRIEQLMRERWLGSNYSSRLWGNTQRLADAAKNEVLISFLTGRKQLDAWRAIEGEFHKGHHAARRLIRTEANYLANQAHKEAYKDSGVERYIFVATLDLRTSDICRKMDGRHYLVSNAQPGVNYPPMHPWCRSTTIAWIPDQLRRNMKRRARDPQTGQNMLVPATMTYYEWYNKYVIQEGKNEARNHQNIL